MFFLLSYYCDSFVFIELRNLFLCSAHACSLFWMTKKAGEREGSGLMKANAWHHRADAISSAVALIGVGKNL